MKTPFLLSLPVALCLSLFGACGGSVVADETNCKAYCEDPKANSGNESLCKDYCTDRSATSDGKTETCKDFCAGQAKCDSMVKVEKCEETCNDVDSLSRGGQEVLTKCLEEASCDANAVGNLLCIVKGLDDLPLSEKAKTFCEESQPKLNELCKQPEPETPCEDSIAILSDEFLDDLNECADKSDCASAQTCTMGAVLSNTPAAVLQNPAILGVIGPILNLGGMNPNPGGGEGGAAP